MIDQTSGRNVKLQALGVICLSVFLTACGGGGSSAPPPPTPPAPLTLSTAVNCSAPVVSSSSSSANVWSYSNTTVNSTSTAFLLTGVLPGQSVTFIFSNGAASAATVPSFGASPEPLQFSVAAAMEQSASTARPTALDEHSDEMHSRLQESNRQIAQKLRRTNSTLASTAAAFELFTPRPRSLEAPALGTTKTWVDAPPSSAVTNYSTSAQAACLVPNGRNVVVWVDPVAQSLGKVTASSVASIANTYCGTNGGFDQVTRLLGDAWGASAAQKYIDVIQDSPLQDINIVVVNAPANAGWAGYFWGGNNVLKTSEPNSNQALVFFINANQLKQDVNFTLSTLLHETTHMVNFYQRAILQGYQHDTWLEETSAMMTEDIITPTTVCKPDSSGYNKIASYRLPKYLQTGGAVSYVNWPTLTDSGPNYAIGGAFGAFLNRRYGLSIYQKLITNCHDTYASATAANTSYACLDNLIKTNINTSGSLGIGFADEFARFGTSIFGALPAVGAPPGYGYPSVSHSGYTLMPIDVSAMVSLNPAWLPATAAPLVNGFTAATHTYLRDTVAAGVNTYSRSNIVVPANTTVSLVLK
jgi:hypothetical protein